MIDLHNSFGLVQNEQVLNQWRSQECASACCGSVYYTTLTNQRILLRYDGCTVMSCFCGCCCDRPYHDKSMFLHKISEMDTNSLSCLDICRAWLQCSCPQDGLRFHGDFHGSCFPGGYRRAYLTIDDRGPAQHAIAAAIIDANRRN